MSCSVSARLIPARLESHRTNEINLFGMYPKWLSATRKTKKMLVQYFRITILENAEGIVSCPPLRFVEWVKNEILQSLKIMSLLRLQSSTEGLSGNRFVPPDAPFLAVERVNGTTTFPLSRRTIIPTI
ncbi:hypothetical protein ALC60_02306 [Trachymyrmex zeteki]|uniref:Uncharacterized protein n=1 Tax=Mycetomoellerius zeteki TaxID=64791 RepID=A0A151XE77_9HYME|nr:hypothetical protein ALC60_02306 [Trachymyrmex zeteki]